MIKIYSTPFCPYCVTLKDYLKSKKVEFKDIDVSSDDKARDEMIELSGQIGVPVVNVDGQIVVGFDKEQIDQLLKLK
ncbi:MAG: glutathione S-transferase N-terminal domain-containing protein [Candidatus Pacebacteria bacterium]|nr:glutathione S-transferase N-terminal domain-containing protein [Candidatus Paceibacterota bacterium]